MLTFLKLRNIALIDELEVEFGSGLNLLTGETGSGKSIIVDSLGALTGERLSSDLIKDGAEIARIEGIFGVGTDSVSTVLEESGISIGGNELIIRRELSIAGKNRVFINDQPVTATLLKKIAPFLVDIHGQGEQLSLFDPTSHLALLGAYADTEALRVETAVAFAEWSRIRNELLILRKDDAEKLQLLDILRFQVNELEQAALKIDESDELEDEKRRLNNVEKLSALSSEAFALLYEDEFSTTATIERAARNIRELAEYDMRFREHLDGIETARAVIEDLAITVRDFRGALEFSPERLEEIETRLSEISRVSRKYGGTVEAAIEHLEQSKKRLENIEFGELREIELTRELEEKREDFLKVAAALSAKRTDAARLFSKAVEDELRSIALEAARFEVRIETPASPGDDDFGPDGIDRVEFLFSANIGESPKPLAKVLSGGEASRLMLILKTTARTTASKTAVFDEIDAGIGGRVSEAVGAKLKELARTQQVLCVTHQPQVASQADRHFLVEKEFKSGKTNISIRELPAKGRIEEIARMLAGETITEAARKNARAMLAAAK